MKKHLITGLIILLPLTLTFLALSFVLHILTAPFLGLVKTIFHHFDLFREGFLIFTQEQTIHVIAQVLILATIVLLAFIAGFIARWFFLFSLFKLFDAIFLKIPGVNTVYKATKQLIQPFIVSDTKSFKKVVLVSFPKEGTYALGLAPNEAPYASPDQNTVPYYSVLIPTTPYLNTGYIITCKKEELTFIDMKPKDAIKYIFSCGVTSPKSDNSPSEET